MAYVGAFEEYSLHFPVEICDNDTNEEDNFPKLQDKWPTDTFVDIESVTDDKKLGMMLIQKQLLEELEEKDDETMKKIAELNVNIECLKSRDVESKKVEILKNVVPSKQTINTELSSIKKVIDKDREEHEEKLNVLSAKKKYLRNHLKLLNLSIDDINYEIHKKIQRNDMNYINRISKLEGIRENLIGTVDDECLSQLLMPVDEEINHVKNDHSLVVMSLYCQKNILEKESKLLSGHVEDYLTEINATINTFDSSTPSNSNENNPLLEDVNYLKNTIATPILLGLAEIIAKKPHDPIHYLAHWLFTYRYNKDAMEIKKRELDELLLERERIQDELKKRQAEIDAYDAVIDLLNKMESEHILEYILPDEENLEIDQPAFDLFPNDSSHISK